MSDVRRIGTAERSGVLVPTNLPRFDARWFTPADEVRVAVDAYWSVEWNLPPGDEVEQRILEFPAVTVSIESGEVPAPFVVTGVQRHAWSRTIAGSGRVFALRLRPAGLAVVSNLEPTQLAREQPVTPKLDGRLSELLTQIARAADRPGRADELVGRLLEAHAPSDEHLLANTVLDTLAGAVRSRTGRTLADQVGASERAIQRALRATLGMGPKAVARRIRLQEVVRRLSQPDADVADIAATLGYTDQAHLIHDFRGVAGVTPGAYLRQVRG